MVSISLFWFALCTMILFLCSMCCKAIAWLFEGCISAVKYTLKIGLCGGLAIGALFLINVIVLAIQRDEFDQLILPLIIAVIAICILVKLWDEIGPDLYEGILGIVGGIFAIVSGIILWVGEMCEKGYRYFLDQILEKLKRC